MITQIQSMVGVAKSAGKPDGTVGHEHMITVGDVTALRVRACSTSA